MIVESSGEKISEISVKIYKILNFTCLQESNKM